MKYQKNTPGYAIQMKCHECMGQYLDGVRDCEVTKCPLYRYQPFRQLEPDESWVGYTPRRVGMQTIRQLTDDEKAIAKERFAKTIGAKK